MSTHITPKPLCNFRVMVTATSYCEQDLSLKEALQAAVDHVIYNPCGRSLKASELIELAPEIDGIIAGLDELNVDIFQAAQFYAVKRPYTV